MEEGTSNKQKEQGLRRDPFECHASLSRESGHFNMQSFVFSLRHDGAAHLFLFRFGAFAPRGFIIIRDLPLYPKSTMKSVAAVLFIALLSVSAPTACSFTMTMSNVIAGATGYIGKNVVRESVRQGYNTIALVRDANKVTSKEGQALYKQYFDGATIVECDVTDLDQLETVRQPSHILRSSAIKRLFTRIVSLLSLYVL
jgi:hypothetical protein